MYQSLQTLQDRRNNDEVCPLIASQADVLKGSYRVRAPLMSASGAGTRDGPLRTYAWEASPLTHFEKRNPFVKW